MNTRHDDNRRPVEPEEETLVLDDDLAEDAAADLQRIADRHRVNGDPRRASLVEATAEQLGFTTTD